MSTGKLVRRRRARWPRGWTTAKTKRTLKRTLLEIADGYARLAPTSKHVKGRS